MPNVVELGTSSESASPETTALVLGNRRVSYREFSSRVNALGRELIGAGVGPDIAVAVAMPRSVELLVAIHAVNAAGGHYVPVDIDAPAERVEYMVSTAGAKVALVAAGTAEVAGLGALQVMVVDASTAVGTPVAPISDADRTAPLRADDAAYTLFTSGSTGRPKGVTVSHRAIVNRLEWMRDWYRLGADDVFLQKTPATFDVSVWELFLPLALGATLVIAEPDRHGDPTYIADVIEAEGVTAIHFVPSMLAAFVDVLGDRLSELTSLRMLFTSGEALTVPVARAVLTALGRVELHNLYGPTEAAVDVTAQHVRHDDPTVPIGIPVPETTTFVLDPRLQLVPRGVPGELYLGGVQLARGYAARAELTAERFIADPFGDAGDRLYRTGDLVRWNSAGHIEYLGRTDFQVKLRGQRLELGEVEAVIAAAPGVVHAAADVAKLPAGDQLVAYLAPHTVDLDAVKSAVAAALPEYMRPTVWMVLDAMPLNSAGKVARRQLPAPEIIAAEYVAPEPGVQRQLAEVYATVLGLDEVSAAESFFNLGGNSLAATRLAARIGAALDVDITVRDIFDTPSIRELAVALAGRGRQIAALTARERPARLPLSTAQQRMWFINQFDPVSPAYNIPMGLQLRGDLNLEALGEALGDLLERHEILRTIYPSDDHGPIQRILSVDDARAAFTWSETSDLSGLVQAASTGFNVSADLPIRGAFRRTDEGADVVVVAHHIAFDGESTPVFVRDLLAAYLRRTGDDVPALPPLGVQYADFALWQRDVLGSSADPSSPMGKQLAYWREHLADLPAVTDLPMDRPRPAVLDTAAAVLGITVDEALAAGIDDLARTHQATGFMITHAALAITVARLAATTDVVIGSPIAGRTDAALEDLVGMFVNTLVLRTAVHPAQSVGDFLNTVRSVDLDAFANADAQFDDLIEDLAPERSTAHQPLVQIAFTHVGAGGRADLGVVELPGLTAQALTTAEPVAKFDLTVEVTEASADNPMTVRFLYATSLFDEATVQRLADAWLQAVAAMVTDPGIATGDIDLVGVDPASRAQSVVSRNSVGGTDPAADGGVSVPAPLPDLLAQRPTDPEHRALICDGVELTYREFDDRTNALARALIKRGVAPDDIIAVGLERSIDSVIAVFGILKAGAAYVPIDPAYPQDRIDYMIADSGVQLGLTNTATRDRLGGGPVDWIDIAAIGEADPTASGTVTAGERNGILGVDNLAYLVYTSGSTGRPKAVGVSHRGLANFIDQFREVSGSVDDAPDTRVLHVASPSFDASVLEMLWSIGLGHTLVIAPASEYAGEALGRVLDRDGVTDTLITPSVLATVNADRGHRIRNLVTGGEACPPELIARWASAADRTMYNFYGPSEATVWSLTGRSVPGQPVTIGHPVRGFAAYVLDARLHRVPVGVVGELYLASDDSLARGYLGRPGQTSGAFVADPYSADPGTRMYATGDLVRVNSRGDIEFAGRADHQVKINGQRVELGEIEAVLADLPAIDSAVVTGVRDSSGRARLVAYLVAATGTEFVVSDVLAEAATRLAAHMVPHLAVVLETLPLTPGGKLDRRALPIPEFTSDDADLVAPASAVEEALAAIVAGLLGRERVSVTESFFALGGDSIMSIQLASAARAAGLPLSPREIFEHKNVRAMARAATDESRRLPMIAEPGGTASGPVEISPITNWLIDAAPTAADFADFNQAMVLNAPATITADQLAQVLAAVVLAHPMLAASLSDGEDGWSFISGTAFDAEQAITVVDADDLETAVSAAHAADAVRLDPTRGAMIRLSHVRSAAGARVVVTIHHLSVDAVSWPILIEDFVTAWAQLSSGQPIALRREASSVRAWNAALADHRADRASELGYWLDRSPRTPNRFGTAFDPVRDRYAGTESVVHTVPTEIAGLLVTQVPEAFGGNATDALLAALGRAVRTWQQTSGIVDDAPVAILSEGHGRYEDVLAEAARPAQADLSRTVGWFTTIAPVLIDPSTDPIHTVKAVKEERLAQPGHGIGYGLLRFGGDNELAQRPLPSIAFNYLGGSGAVAETASADEAAPEVGFLPAAAAPFLPSVINGGLAAMAPLVVNASTVASPDGPVLSADFRFAPAVLSSEDVRAIAENWTRELSMIVAESHGDVGLSPSDVPGSGISQADLDLIARDYPGSDVWPLTPLQRGLYFQSQLTVGNTATNADAVDVYVTQAILHLGGDIDIARLRTAANDLVSHHRALRSAFVQTASGAIVGVVPASVDLPWRLVDLTTTDEAATAGEIASLAAAEKLEPFDMAAAPLMRIVLVRHGGQASVIITNHHILFDGWSGPLVMADLLALYATGATYTGMAGEKTGDFADYARRIGGADQAAGIAAWREVLAPVTEPTLVAANVKATADTMPRDLRVALGRELTSAIEELSRGTGATVATVLQFAWAILISRYTGNRIVTLGETVSGRPADLDGVESMVGLFINTLPAVVDVDPAATGTDLLAALQADKVKVLDHQHLGLPELTALTGLPTLFDTLTVYESYPVDTESLASADTSAVGEGLSILGAEVSDATHYPLNLGAAPTADGILLTLKYLPNAFSDRQVQGFADALQQVLSHLAAHPERLIGDLPLVAPEHLAGAVLAPSADAVTPRRYVDMLADRDFEPDHAAIIALDRVITFAEFEALTNRVARALIAKGIGPEDVVAVVIDRSVEAVAAVWGTAKTGATFVGIDPAHPDERLAGMLDDTRSRFGITVGDNLARLSGFDPEWLLIDDLANADVDDGPIAESERNGTVYLDNLAYLIFTSGTTGRPKAAANTNRGMATLADELARITLTRADHESTRILQLSSPSFDAWFFEMVWSLGAGHTMVVAPASAYAGPALDAIFRDYGITDVFVTPSVLATLDVEQAPTLRNLLVGGEACPQELVDKWSAAGKTMHNFYGPSEATVISSTARLEAGKPVTIGHSVRGFTGYVLDERLHPVPHGFIGELYLAAPQGLGRGYLRRPGMTAGSFVANPFTADGTRMYATGDMVRITDNAELEYTGRADFQVKIAGQRIELGEVETALTDLTGVETAVVVGVGKPAKSLAAYVVADEGVEVSVDDLREGLRHRLPSFMVPASIMVIDEIPINAVGKLDRAALPEPEFHAAEYVAPATAEEAAVAEIFADMLGLDQVGVTTSFFELGGNSLTATRLVARVSEALGVEISVRDAFEASTVRSLVRAVTGRGAALEKVSAVLPRPQHIPLSFAQQRIWFINQLEPASAVYNVPAVVRLTGPLNAGALRSAVIDVVGRHEVLRTTFPSNDGIAEQVIHSPQRAAEILDWSVVNDPVEVERAVTTGFDLGTDLPIRGRLLAVGPDEHVLAVVAHHIAADGESVTPLLTDLVIAYAARSAGTTPDFEPLEVQFADFALWQHRVLGAPTDSTSVVGRQLAYWRTQLAGVPDVLELPTDRLRPAVASHRGGQVRFELPDSVGDRVDVLARECGVTPFMLVHAALAVLLGRLASTDDVSIATPIAGRGQQALDGLVGMFVNSLVLRTKLSQNESFATYLAEVKRIDIDAFAHADAPFETVVEAVDPVRSEAFAPLAQVVLAVASDNPDSSVTLGELRVEPVADIELPAQYDLHVNVSLGHGQSSSILYATDLFDAATINSIAEQFAMLLDGLTAHPDRAVGEASILNASARERVLEFSSGPEAVLDRPLIATIVESANRVPDALAVFAGGKSYTYRELMARADALAFDLSAEGIGVDNVVVLALDRSVHWVVAMVATWKVGAAYAPVDPEAPSTRIRALVEDAAASAVVGTDAWIGQRDARDLPESVRRIALGDDESAEPFPTAQAPDGVSAQLGYVITTSGSTGRPKPTLVPIRGIENTVGWYVHELNLAVGDGVLIASSPTFDLTQKNVWAALASGATLYLAESVFNPQQILRDLAVSPIAVLNMAPSAFDALVESDDDGALSHVRSLFLGGEPVRLAPLRALIAGGLRVFNSYGPTEASDVVSFREVRGDEEGSVPIGRPIGGVDLLVLDARLGLVPAGVPGELYVGGIAVGRGYGAMTAMTSERFIANPFTNDSTRIYRTGDLAMWTHDGELKYLGRTDTQIKLRGLRIELGEIETVLAEIPEVVQAAVTVVESGGLEYLSAYVVPESVNVDAARRIASAALPGYMVPTLWTTLDRIALNAAGKIDRQRLPTPRFAALEQEYVAPETPIEEAIAAVFGDVIGAERVSATASFFDIGGNSLSATRVRSRLKDRNGLEIELSWLFSDPSPRALADRIARGNEEANDVLIALRSDGTRAPLFCIHPAGGLSWFYGGFLPYLPDRPIYGLQDPHVVAGEDAYTTIEAMAGRYIAEIRAVQPEGPYHLLGWSIGGVIAFAMANQLERAGQKIGYLGVMDAQPDTVESMAAAAEAAADPEGAADDQVDADDVMDVLGSWRALFNLGDDVTASNPEDLAEIIRTQVAGMGLFGEDQVGRIMNSFATAGDVALTLRPEPFDGLIQVFVATADKPDPSAMADAWRPFVTDLEPHYIDTHHLGMTDAASLAVIGPEVNAALSADTVI